jgi:hypothetical protein
VADVSYHLRTSIIKVDDPRKLTGEKAEELINNASNTLLLELKSQLPLGFEIVSHSIGQVFGNISVSFVVRAARQR